MKSSNTARAMLALGLFLFLLHPAPTPARVNLVTLPGRDSVQLTIYNSADLTLVKETRHLTLREGINRLEFSWANTLIDPTSLEFRALTQADRVEVLDVSFPPRVTNTLEWRIQSEISGEVIVEIRYFTSGITWSADYVVTANPAEAAMSLAGYVKVSNASGETYENAQVRLVVGVIRLVEDIADLARLGRPGLLPPPPMVPAPRAAPRRLAEKLAVLAVADEAAGLRAKEVIKEELSEYFLYTVEGRDTLPDGWSKRLPSFHAKDVPITSYYKYELERWGDQVIRYYRFTNNVASALGKEPLPDGHVQAFRDTSDDGLLGYVGGTTVQYIPMNETVDLELGPDLEVRIEPKLLDWRKTDIRFDNDGNVSGWTIQETWELDLRNSKDISATLDIRRNFPGDWTLASGTAHEQLDTDTVKFLVPLAPREQQRVRYELVTRFGTNVNR